MIMLTELLAFSTKADPWLDQPSLNSNPCANMNEASQNLEPIPLPVKLDKKFIDLSGQRFGDLEVIGYFGRSKTTGTRWLCKCSCGKSKDVSSAKLRNGEQKSCGCKKGYTKHGENRQAGPTPEYRCLHNVIQRCTNPNHNAYPYYGGRGIECRWTLADYPSFLLHVGRRPTPSHSIDRINNDGHYEPGNVRWATKKEQTLNSRKVVLVTAFGETLCLADMAARHGMNWYTLRDRLKSGMSPESAISTPLKRNLKK